MSDDNESYSFDNEPSTPPRLSGAVPATKTLSMSFIKSLSGICCQECGTDPIGDLQQDDEDAPSELYNLHSMQRSISSVYPLLAAPMSSSVQSTSQTQVMLGEYMALCQFYHVPYNAGVLTTLRYRLPTLRLGGSFHDTDMLVLAEMLLKHANGALQYVRRLDFTMAGREGKRYRSIKPGFTSHGALALAKTLQHTKFITQVWLPKHRIGAYGASALFWACSTNTTIHNLNLRRCHIGERGAFAFCELLLNEATGLQDVDLSANGMGHRGTTAIEKALEHRAANEEIYVNLEGNLVFPEIMNGVTHGFGTIMCLIGGYLLSDRVKDLSHTHKVSCAVYTTSLLVLYLSSTLYHSFFSLQHTKYVFMVFDKCAIYILIAGSYTPFMKILFDDQAIWSVGLLGFIWMCCFLGISVEAFAPTWKRKKFFSLAMYLGMGWAAVACFPQMKERLPQAAMNCLVLGGVGYTAGVPFFIRNNNLDHAIWHLFVLAGSVFHWFCVYLYVAPRPLPQSADAAAVF